MILAANTTSSTAHFCFIKSARQHKRHGQFITGSFCIKAKLRF